MYRKCWKRSKYCRRGKLATALQYIPLMVSITDHIDALCRSLCKDPAAAGGQASEEKEDHGEEEHLEPVL